MVVQTSIPTACPEGITRQVILDLCKEHGIECIERDISMAHVYNANECFTTGTMGELAWVGEIDGRKIGDGKIGEMTKVLSALFTTKTRASGVQVV